MYNNHGRYTFKAVRFFLLYQYNIFNNNNITKVSIGKFFCFARKVNKNNNKQIMPVHYRWMG